MDNKNNYTIEDLEAAFEAGAEYGEASAIHSFTDNRVSKVDNFQEWLDKNFGQSSSEQKS